MDPRLPQAHSVWLCPERTAHDLLAGHIARLLPLSFGVGFAPHVTLLGDMQGAPQTTMDACDQMFHDHGPVTATVTGIAQSERFFMSLFLDLALAPDMAEPRQTLQEITGSQGQTPLRAHLSLAYGVRPGALEAADIAALAAVFQGMTFDLDHGVVVLSSQETAIADWRVVHRFALAGVQMPDCEK